MLKTFALLLFATLMVSSSFGGEKDTAPGDGETLYLHYFSLTYGQQVILDPSDNKDATPAVPPRRLLTLKLKVGEDFDVVVNDHGNGVTGKTTSSNGKLVVDLQGTFGPSQYRFSGPIELERVFDPQLHAFASVAKPFRCVVSKHKAVKPFLESQSVLDKQRLDEATESTRRNIDGQQRKVD